MAQSIHMWKYQITAESDEVDETVYTELVDTSVASLTRQLSEAKFWQAMNYELGSRACAALDVYNV